MRWLLNVSPKHRNLLLNRIPYHWNQCTVLCIWVCICKILWNLTMIHRWLCMISFFLLKFFYSCPYLTTNITSAIPIVGAILYVFTMSSLLRTTFTDPGVIPRALHDEAAYIEKQIGINSLTMTSAWHRCQFTKFMLPWHSFVFVCVGCFYLNSPFLFWFSLFCRSAKFIE